jgi:hypothetical protein
MGQCRKPPIAMKPINIGIGRGTDTATIIPGHLTGNVGMVTHEQPQRGLYVWGGLTVSGCAGKYTGAIEQDVVIKKSCTGVVQNGLFGT